MNGLNSPQSSSKNNTCLLIPETQLFVPRAEDILTDEDLLDLFRIVKQVLHKNPDSEKVAKLLFCMFYALGDNIKFIKPCHEDRIIFRDTNSGVNAVQLPNTGSCCSINSSYSSNQPNHSSRVSSRYSVQKWIDSSSVSSPIACPSPTKLPTVSCNTTSLPELSNGITNTIRPYTNFRPLYASSSPSSTTHSIGMASPVNHGQSIPSPTTSSTVNHVQQHIAEAVSLLNKESPDHALPNFQPILNPAPHAEIVMEPQQRGFYYQDGRISREPASLQRYAEQGILTQASLMRKRKKNTTETIFDTSTSSIKKPKIPHRNGGFDQRRDDIIHRLREITMEELEQKAQRMPNPFTLTIDQTVAIAEGEDFSKEQIAELLAPSLRILTNHSNMKPHLDNGMNQNGIYYNSDYYRLYLAFEQFQHDFAILLPEELSNSNTDSNENTVLKNSSHTERDKDRERNANMKAYRVWIEPLLTETNWAAFRRNIVVGERIMQLTKSVGQGVLLMTKELSGSKLHLTFTNSEWDEFMNGLNMGKWDKLVEIDSEHQESNTSLLVSLLQQKFATHYWFTLDGFLVSSQNRRLAIHNSTVNNSNNPLLMHRNSVEPS